VGIWVLIGAAIVVAGAWLFRGRIVVGWVDRFFLVNVRERVVRPLEVREREIVVGDRKWPLDGALEQADWKSFHAQIEEGDVISMTTSHSWLVWPRLFEINFLGGAVSRWRRHAYNRLTWKKASGQKLEIVWRHQEWFYRGSGWCDQWDLKVIVMRIEPGAMERIVVQYLQVVKGWERESYRIEDRGLVNAHRMIAIIHRDDGNARQPGAGKSVTLFVNEPAGKVVNEVGGQ
jgi:hypothetical protein